MKSQYTPLAAVVVLLGTFLVSDPLSWSRRDPDQQRIEFRDSKGLLRMVVGEIEPGAWGFRVFDEQSKPRVGVMLFDASQETRMTLTDPSASRGINMSVDPNLGRCHVQVGHSLDPADASDPAAGRDAIVLECTDKGLSTMGVFSGRAEARIAMGSNPTGPTVGVHVFDDDHRPRASLLRKSDGYGWVIMDASGKPVARTRYSGKDGLSIEPDK